MNSDFELVYVIADEELSNSIIEGNLTGHHPTWPGAYMGRVGHEEIGVLARAHIHENFAQPIGLVVDETAHRRLFGRFATLRSEFSPLSAWCHILDRRTFDGLETTRRDADLNGLEAAWSGLVIAEAVLLSNRSPERLRLNACLATASYAIARASGLWPWLASGEIAERYDACNRLVRGGVAAKSTVTRRLTNVWNTLLEIGGGLSSTASPSARALNVVRFNRSDGVVDDHASVLDALQMYPEFSEIVRLENVSPEQRVGIFDSVVTAIGREKSEQRRASLSFLAGYLATVAAGGMPSLTLAEQISSEHPDVLAWAYVIGGVGERVTWTSGFNGLGRLVWRELTRPFHIDEAPQCDFALEEAAHLVDKQLNDPLVHLKIKQQRSVSVALYPGVNVAVPLIDNVETATPDIQPAQPVVEPHIEELFSSMWPLIRHRILAENLGRDQRASRTSTSKKRSPQGKLPLR